MDHRWRGNRICALLGIEQPIIQAGMIYNSGARLAAAAAEAGCLGLIGAGSMRPDLFAEQIAKARRLTERPVGVNLPLIYPHYAHEGRFGALAEWLLRSGAAGLDIHSLDHTIRLTCAVFRPQKTKPARETIKNSDIDIFRNRPLSNIALGLAVLRNHCYTEITR